MVRGLGERTLTRLVRVHHRVYGLRPPESVLEDAQAVELVLRGRRAFGFETAAQLRGLPAVGDWEWHPGPRLHVLALDQGRTRLSTVQTHRGSAPIRVGALPRLSTPVASGPDVFAQLAATLSLMDLVILGDAVVGWRSGVDVARLAEAIHPGTAGAARARAALALVRAGSASPMETRVRLLLHDAGLPEPLLNAPVVEGRTWLATVDFLWPRHRLVVEYHGGHHFRSDEQRLGDLHRGRRLRDHGYRVEEITRLDLREPGRVVARVSTALADQERLLRLV